jgi:hypothetical protein
LGEKIWDKGKLKVEGREGEKEAERMGWDLVSSHYSILAPPVGQSSR